MKRFIRKFLGVIIPILIVAAGIWAVYFFVYTDAYLKLPSQEDKTGSEYIGNWTELGRDDPGDGAKLILADNGRALIKDYGRVASVGKWSESEDGVEFIPLVESKKFTRETFSREKTLSGRSPDSLGYAGDCFLLNRQVAFAQTSTELVLDMDSRGEALKDIKENLDILSSDDTWDFSRAQELKEMWTDFWAGFKELINSLKN